nr:putative ribonuclease H-like domain-containing protein [Tanacetum cinerariifolium]
MALTFAETHNMITFLTKSDASEGFEQILDFLNASVIQYALVVNPTVYVSCIKQFWSYVSIKKTNDVVRLHALIDRRKVIITEDTVRQTLRLDDADSIDCLPNEEIFAELASMGYEKPSTKLTFYKAFFSAQWKSLIYTILQCMSAKRTAWNEFSSSMASAVICLVTGRKFNFSKYLFDSLVRNVDSPSKFYMYPRFLQLMINAQITDLSYHTTKYTSPALTQKVFANMKKVGKGFYRVDTPLFEGMLVPQQVQVDIDVAVEDEDAAEPTPPTPAPTPPPPQELIPSSSQVSPTPPLSPHHSPIAQPSSPPQPPPSQPLQPTDISLDLFNTLLETCTTLTRRVENLEQDKIAQALEITKLKQREDACKQGGGIAKLDADEDVTLEEFTTEVSKDADVQGRLEESQAQVYHLDLEHAQKVLKVVTAAAPMPTTSAQRKRKGVVIKDPEETATPSVIVYSEPKSKDKGKGILEIEEEASKRKSETSKEKAAKKQKLNKKVEELKTHLQIIPNDEDDVYTEATPLALKVPVVDYQIHTDHNKPYYKIIRADGTHQLFLSVISLLRNFDREDLEMLLHMENQRGSYGLVKVKSWKLLESCGVHIITFTTTQMILLVKRRHPFTRFTLDQMLNNVRLEVEKESEVSLELLRFVRRQQQEGYRPDFGVDAVEDLKEYTLRDYYCWLKTYCCVLNTQMSANDKFGLGYGDYRYGSILSYENEVLQRNYMLSGPDVEIGYSKFTYGLKHTSVDESDSKPSESASCESDSSAETPTSMLEPVESAPKDDPHKALKDKGIGYSGCSKHMIGNKAYLADYQEFKGGSIAFGELKHYNLFSVSQMCDKKNKVLFTNTDCLVLSPDFKLPDENQVLLKIPSQHNMYSFNLKNIDPSRDLSCLFVKASIDEYNKWHRRLGHVNFKNLNKLVKGNLVRGSPFKIFENDHTCVACQKGKQHKASCKAKAVSSVNQPLQILHIDLFGPTSVRSINHKTYCLVFTDGVSRFSWVYFLKSKDETTPILKDFIRQADNQFNHKVKTIRNDNGIEFKNNDLIEFCGLKRIKREYSNARTPQQNRVGKRKNMTLIEAARTIKAFRVYNLETKRVEENTYVNFLDNKPNVAGKGHAWMFDLYYLTNSMNHEPVLVENQANKSAGPKEANNSACTQAKDDQGANSEEIDLHDKHFVLPIWSAYSTSVKSSGDKIQKTTSCKTYEKPVSQIKQIFYEELEKLKRQEKEANDAARKETTHENQDANTNSTNLLNAVSVPISTVDPSRALNLDEPSYLDDPSMPHLEDIYTSLSKGIFTDSSYDDEGVVTDFNNLEITVNVSPTPTTRIHTIHPKTQILGDPMSAIQTRSKVNKNSKAHALKEIRTKWVYGNKKDERGVVVRNKARLVAQGHRQKEGIDYDEVFTLVVRIEAIRIFLAFSSYMGFIVYQMDVKSAFLYKTIDEEVYVIQPPSFVDPKFPNKVYNLYGLHQAPRACVKTASTLIETQKPLVKDEEAVDVDVTPKTLHLQAVKRIFRRLISWQCKKQTIMATSTIEAKYLAAAHCPILVKERLLEVTTTKHRLILPGIGYCCQVNEALAIPEQTTTDNADGVECLPTEEIFVELARMSYEKLPPKLTFYKVFFSAQWKFLIHTLVQCVSAKRTAWNEISCSMASAVICLATDDLSSHITKYTSLALTQKVFANMRIIGKGFSGIETLVFATMLVQPQATAKEKDEEDEVLRKVGTSQRVESSTETIVGAKEDAFKQGRRIEDVIRQALRLDDADGVECLPNEDIFTELARMGYEKPPPKLTAKRTAWNEFSCSMASAVICLATGGCIQTGGRNEAIDVDDEIILVGMETQVDFGAELQGRKDIDNAAIKETSAVEPTMDKRLHDEEVEKLQCKRSILTISRNTVAQARKNIIIYLKNMAGYKMEHSREEPTKKRVAKETLLQKSFKKLKAVEVSGSHSTQDTPTHDLKEMSKEDVKNMLEIVLVSEFKVKALQVKYPLIDWEIHSEGSRSYWKIIRVGGITKAYLSFEDMLKADVFWKLQRYTHDPLIWILYTNCGVHQVSSTRRHDIFMLTEKVYPLTDAVMILMLSAKLQVDEDCKMARDLVMKIFRRLINQKAKVRIHPSSDQEAWIKET